MWAPLFSHQSCSIWVNSIFILFQMNHHYQQGTEENERRITWAFHIRDSVWATSPPVRTNRGTITSWRKLPWRHVSFQVVSWMWDNICAANLLTQVGKILLTQQRPYVIKGPPLFSVLSFQGAFTVGLSSHQSHSVWTWTETRGDIFKQNDERNATKHFTTWQRSVSG